MQNPPRAEAIELALSLIRGFEGFSAKAYQCPAGRWTIGYGTCRRDGQPVQPGMTVTRAEAEILLRKRVKNDAIWIRQHNTVTLTSGQWAALLDFTYNFSTSALASSTLWKKLQAGDIPGAAEQFLKWVFARNPETGQLIELPGLKARRAKEKELFLHLPNTATEPSTFVQ